MAVLLDTSAWIEYFIGSKHGKRVSETLHSGDSNTCIVSIAEVEQWALKNGQDPSLLVEAVDGLSNVVQLDKDIARMAGEINFKRKKAIKKWGMVDSLILATAIKYGLKVLTKDSDFRGLSNTILLSEVT
ncbi:MAG TPA: PIN domain-containing protein [Candidatus Acidoferrales bacterium]|nr:PIN domain-containing protein [Candidatus Acidoferrales bacterium]